LIIFRYILWELIPQFISALIIACMVLLISQLARLAEVLVNFGFSLENMLLPPLFVILPFMSFTIPWAFLFAVIITFGRLSSDGEFTAMLAAGYSLVRCAIPVFITGVVLYIMAATSAMHLEPWAKREFERFFYDKAQTELDSMVRFKLQPGIFLTDFLGFTLYAEKISKDRTKLENVMLSPNNQKESSSFTIWAPHGSLTGTVASADLTLALKNGTAISPSTNDQSLSLIQFDNAEIDLLRIFRDRILGGVFSDDDYRSYPPEKLYAYLDILKTNKKKDLSHYWRARYLYHKRISVPFTVIIFVFFGTVLGLQDPRHGKSRGFVGGVLAIIGSYVLVMFSQWSAENGYLDALLAAWLPNVILLSIGGFWLYQRNRLPLSEPAFAPQYFPGRTLEIRP
jgi:lipopolysaccharide export system permease protein